MGQSPEAKDGEAANRRHPQEEWIAEIVDGDPGNGNGKRGGGRNSSDHRPDGKPTGGGSGGNPETPGPQHFMPPQSAQHLGGLSLSGNEIIG